MEVDTITEALYYIIVFGLFSIVGVLMLREANDPGAMLGVGILVVISFRITWAAIKYFMNK